MPNTRHPTPDTRHPFPQHPVYLDHAATTPTDPLVVEAMLPFLSGMGSYGNPSSIHAFGRQARDAVDMARDSVAKLIGADYSEIFFTGSGTEADNLALIGCMEAASPGRKRLLISSIEHHAILHSAHFIAKQGYEVTILPVDSEGTVSQQDAELAISDETALVSIMHANNEIGTIQPVKIFADIAHSRGAKFHTDAIQTAGLLSLNVGDLECDLLSLSGHKIYGPKGIGALYIRQGTKVSPLIHGGAQEREKRAGTENVAAIVGFGAAAELTIARRASDALSIVGLRDQFHHMVVCEIPGVKLNGHPINRLPNIVNISIEGVEGPTLLMNLDRKGVYASSGSACSSGSIEPSHVLKAIGLSDSLAAGGIRFSLGRSTTLEEITKTVQILSEIVQRLSFRGIGNK